LQQRFRDYHRSEWICKSCRRHRTVRHYHRQRGSWQNPIGIDVISRLGYAVVANSGDTTNGTASIIDISNPESPQIVPITTTSGTTTTTANSVTVQVSPLGVKIDQDRALALWPITVQIRCRPSTDVLAPSVTGGHNSDRTYGNASRAERPPTAIAVIPTALLPW